MIKKIAGFSGYYVRDDGKVFSTKRGPMKEKKSCRCKDGYVRVQLCRDGKVETFLVHQLVAIAFIPNPNNYTEVNHKDEDKTNNTVDNLEWCDHKYNVNYGTRNERISEALVGKMVGEKNPMYNKTHPEKTKRKMSETKIGRKIVIHCKELNKTFYSYNECNRFMASYLGLKYFNVSYIIKHQGGHHIKHNLYFYEV